MIAVVGGSGVASIKSSRWGWCIYISSCVEGDVSDFFLLMVAATGDARCCQKMDVAKDTRLAKAKRGKKIGKSSAVVLVRPLLQSVPSRWILLTPDSDGTFRITKKTIMRKVQGGYLLLAAGLLRTWSARPWAHIWFFCVLNSAPPASVCPST